MSQASAFAGPYNRAILEDAWQRWQQDPASVDASWQAFFAGVEFSGQGLGGAATTDDIRRQSGAVRYINTYRELGHLAAHIDPLADRGPDAPWLISLERFHLKESDLDHEVDGSMVFGVNGPIRLRELLDILRTTYSGTVGVEYMHLQDLEARKWLAERMEPQRMKPQLSRRQKLRTLMTLHWAEMIEKFLHRKYVGQKRFSLEGGETMLPMIDAIVEKSPSLGLKEIVIGMAHRGRLSLLANILRMPYAELFNEFEDRFLPEQWDGDGDVKYHIGISSDIATRDGGRVHVSLTPNPSHLEIVNPIVEGRVRCKQQLHHDRERTTGMPLLIHGDAAMSGQGCVPETLNMANLPGYTTGGTLHIVTNNQIGFTTRPKDGRSTHYCTDIAKFIQAPIFHVNGDDPESAVMLAELALEYRQHFKKDIVIDLVCYRKWGHNEADEPSFTQPVEYAQIRKKESVTAIYAKKLAAEGSIPAAESDAIVEDFSRTLEKALVEVKSGPPKSKGMKGYAARWKGLTKDYNHAPAETAVPADVLERIAKRCATVPEGFKLHEKLVGILNARRDMVLERKPIDWGTAEALAFGSLVLEGHGVRLSGQDVRRGTFSHRHACAFDSHTGKPFCFLQHLDEKQGHFEVCDSHLSEMAVLGFEYGYSIDDPNTLVLWEAQFGDFFNGAPIVIDQFVASGESKWKRSSGLVMLLPHGMEGAGPEHSSARLERFLTMCAEDDWQVCNFTSSANYFHALRRQLKRPFRKPLIVMSPKSLLRNAMVARPLEEFTNGRFYEVLDDDCDAEAVRRVLLCSGKVAIDLFNERAKRKTDQVAIVRLEQFYPWPEEPLKAVLAKYRRAVEWKWVQEESQNDGGWTFVEPRLRAMGVPVEYVGRDASASPATGSHFVHEHEQKLLVEQAFTAAGSYAVTMGRNGANGELITKNALVAEVPAAG